MHKRDPRSFSCRQRQPKRPGSRQTGPAATLPAKMATAHPRNFPRSSNTCRCRAASAARHRWAGGSDPQTFLASRCQPSGEEVGADPCRAYVSLEGPSFVKAGISITTRDGLSAHARYEPSGKSAGYSDLNWRQTFSHRAIFQVAQLLGLEDAQPAKSKKAA